jgi:hypothetical protein
MKDYIKFLESKQKRVNDAGFDIHLDDLNARLFPFQKHCVATALRKGRFAFFEDCGLGKTFQQLEWAKHVSEYTTRPVLILAPLAVSAQTIAEGERWGIQVTKLDGCPGFKPGTAGVYITNYEQIHNLSAADFSGIVLDESSILKNFEGKTRTAIIENFADTPYKLACTATPSPNDPMELGNHSEFLGVMSRNEMLAMYFVHDGGNTSKWRLKGHAQQSFYDWVSEWAIMMTKPSDIGYIDDGYILPGLNIIEEQITTPKRDNGLLFNEVRVSATDFNGELRMTRKERMERAAEIVNATNEPCIVWIKQNEEGELIKSLIPGAVEVKGSDKPEDKEARLIGFAKGEFRVLITKTKIAQFGLNYQNCRNQIFASLDFSFEGLYQAIRRSYRFGQTQDVNIHVITTDTMQNVIESIKDKERKFSDMQKSMADAVNKNINSTEKQKQNRMKEQVKTDWYDLRLGDCVQLIQDIPSQSVGFSVFSPPFAELYTYSDELEDMGNSKDYEEFLFAFRFLVKELSRVLMAGRNVAVHCMDLPIQKGKEGYIGLRDFSGMIRDAFEAEGFIYHSRVTIWKDPVVEMQRTKALGLLHKQIKKDAVMSRVGIPDYLMVFRNAGDNETPVTHQDKDPSRTDYMPVDLWQKYASPIWYDIDYSDTLNYRAGRSEKDEKHICPLQLPTIERAVRLWSNEGETVLTPFAGVGSEIYQAIKLNRKGIGFELKKSYFDEAVKNCNAAVLEKSQKSLFH